MLRFYLDRLYVPGPGTTFLLRLILPPRPIVRPPPSDLGRTEVYRPGPGTFDSLSAFGFPVKLQLTLIS